MTSIEGLSLSLSFTEGAKAAEADLIVLGARRGVSWLNRFWDSVVEQIVAQAKCPVLTICTN